VFADVLASISLGVVVFDLEGREIVFCNRWARGLLGRARVAIDYVSLASLLLPPGRRGAGAVAHPETVRVGTRFLGFSVYYGDAVAWVFVRDITEKRRLEAIAEAVETTNNLGYVFSAVRHELGNPINSIKVALSVLQVNLESHSLPTIADYIERMQTEIGRVERLLRTLRSFSAYERPHPEPVDLAEFWADFLRLVRPELAARDIEVTTAIEAGLVVSCDPRALHQVMLNLVTNAADAVAGRADAAITLRASASDAVVIVRLDDNGPGIAADQRAHLFKPFSTTKPQGTGLGLVITRKLLAAMSGTITLESTEGAGTTATIALPRAHYAPSSRGLGA
jgi:signal transduction histidine kinase